MTSVRHPGTQRGFTILELLLAIGLFSFVIMGIGSVLGSNQNLFGSGQGKIEAQQNVRIALETMAREVRLAGHDLANTIALQSPATAVQTATASSLTFLSDINNDNVLDKITFRLSGTQLYRDFASWNGSSFPSPASSVLAANVSSLSFAYFDCAQPTNNAILAPVASGSLGTIRRIQIGVTASQRVGSAPTQSYSTVTDVRLRNL